MVGEFEDALLGAPECFVLLPGEGVVAGPVDGRRKDRFQEPEISGAVLRSGTGRDSIRRRAMKRCATWAD
jgi:hypothetical protein